MGIERVLDVVNKIGESRIAKIVVDIGSVGGMLYAAVLGGSLGLAAVAGVVGSEVVWPWTPPRVKVSSNAIRVESRNYLGPHLTKYFTGETKVEWFVPDLHLGFWRHFPEYIERNGDGLVDQVMFLSPLTGRRIYERGEDLAQNLDVFAIADREFKKVLDKYKPYISQAERSIY